jgi:hypothetical protein
MSTCTREVVQHHNSHSHYKVIPFLRIPSSSVNSVVKTTWKPWTSSRRCFPPPLVTGYLLAPVSGTFHEKFSKGGCFYLRSHGNTQICFFLGNVVGKGVEPWVWVVNIMFCVIIVELLSSLRHPFAFGEKNCTRESTLITWWMTQMVD